MRRSNSYVDRAADLSGQSDLRLQFWARARSFESGDTVDCLVSPDDRNWTVVQTWENGDDDNTYHFYDIDLSPYTMSDEFWVAFRSGMGDNRDYFYVDNLEIVDSDSGSSEYEIVSTAEDMAVWAVVRIEEGAVSVLSWQSE
jgi:hypothetical protein